MAEDTPVERVKRNYRFATIPEWVLYHPKLSATAKVVYGVLDRRGSTFADCFPSHADIAKRAGISVRSVPRPLAELESVGAIRSIHRGRKESGGRTSDAYWLAGDEPLGSVEDLLVTAHESEETSESYPANERGTNYAQTRREREPVEREPKSSLSSHDKLVNAAFKLLVERDVTSGNPDNPRGYRVTCRKSREDDGTRGVLNDLANKHPDFTAEELADAADGYKQAEPRPAVWCVFCQLADEHQSYECTKADVA